MPILTLKPGHVQPIWAGHPWVYQQAVSSLTGGAVAGDEVRVHDPRGNFLGRGYYSPKSAIVVRILSQSERPPLDAAFFRSRLERALERRHRFGLPSRETDGVRLVNADGDQLPGLVVDRYADVLVVQLGTIGMKQREPLLLDLLEELVHPRAIVDRSAANAAREEGFAAGEGIVRGDKALSSLRFHERGFFYELPLSLAQKTGFYFDQRPLRGRVEQLAKGRRVLDAYSYVGSFAFAAARGGASEVVACDQSAHALEIGAECARANGLAEAIRFVRSDARQELTRAGLSGGYDMVLCDPPKLAPTRGSKSGALGVYQKIGAAGCRATRPGGLFVLCCCSAAVGLDDLTRALALGAREANVRATVVERFFQGIDHPVPAAFGDGLYLKTVVAFVEAL